jgi:hypothetical protein
MKRIGLFIPALLLSTVLVAPLATQTSAKPQGVSVRIYDREHKDYHDWDDREARYYDRWRHDHPGFVVEFRKNSRSRQAEYWRWRHDHPDDH